MLKLLPEQLSANELVRLGQQKYHSPTSHTRRGYIQVVPASVNKKSLTNFMRA